MRAAAKGDYEESAAKMKEGDGYYSKGHDAHLELLSNEANGAELNAGVILMHAGTR